MRTRQGLAWLSIADGALVAALIQRWAFDDGPHHLIDAVTILTLLLGFVGGARSAVRSLSRARRPAAARDSPRPDALLPFAAERSDAAGQSKAATTQPVTHRPPWLTITAYSALMIALLWRWAILGMPYNVLGAVTLSVLMLGFLRAVVTTVGSLGRTDRTLRSARRHERHDALLIFPAENAGAHDRTLTPPVLATRRNALL